MKKKKHDRVLAHRRHSRLARAKFRSLRNPSERPARANDATISAARATHRGAPRDAHEQHRHDHAQARATATRGLRVRLAYAASSVSASTRPCFFFFFAHDARARARWVPQRCLLCCCMGYVWDVYACIRLYMSCMDCIWSVCGYICVLYASIWTIYARGGPGGVPPGMTKAE
jgi:hypothetical protein